MTFPATDMFWGGHFGEVRDLFGHEWLIATHQRDKTPEEIAAAAAEMFESDPAVDRTCVCFCHTGEVGCSHRSVDRVGSTFNPTSPLVRCLGWVVFERIIEDLKGFSVEGLSRTGLCDVTASISRVRGVLDSLEVAVAVAVDGLGDLGGDAGSMMRSEGGCSKREAARRMRRAERLADMPNTRKLMADGALSAEHVDALAKAAEATSEAAVDSDEKLLGNASRRPADMAGRDIRDWVDRHQRDEDRMDRHTRQRARRSLSIFDGDDDMSVLHCRTDKITGEQLRARIEAVANQLYRQDGGRDGRDGIKPRTWDQLRHDAFTVVMGIDTTAARAGAAPLPGPGGDDDPLVELDRLFSPLSSVRNQIVVVADVATLLGDDNSSSEIPGVGPIPLAVLERLGCDADLFGHVFGVDGVSLWHGRAVRTTTPQQWRSLVARDRGCVICTAAPAYCEAHHVVPWKAGGKTDIENLALMCGRHHHELHDRGQVLIRTGSGWKAVPASGGPTRAGPVRRRPARDGPARAGATDRVRAA